MVLTCTLSLVTGCGNWITARTTGAIGARLGHAHSVELVLNLCSDEVDEVLLYRPHKGPRTKPDIPIGVWRASTPFPHDTVINLGDPGSAWDVRRDPGPLDPGTSYGVEAGYTAEDDQGLRDVNFSLRQLQSLQTGEVRVYNREMKFPKFMRVDWCADY